MDRLPDALVAKILNVLPLEDAANCRRVCTRFRELGLIGGLDRVNFKIDFKIKPGDSLNSLKLLFSEIGSSVRSFYWATSHPGPLLNAILVPHCTNLTRLSLPLVQIYDERLFFDRLFAESDFCAQLTHVNIFKLDISWLSKFRSLKSLTTLLKDDASFGPATKDPHVWDGVLLVLSQLEFMDVEVFCDAIVTKLLDGLNCADPRRRKPLPIPALTKFTVRQEWKRIEQFTDAKISLGYLFPNVRELDFCGSSFELLVIFRSMFPQLTSLELSMNKWFEEEADGNEESQLGRPVDLVHRYKITQTIHDLVQSASHLESFGMSMMLLLDPNEILRRLPVGCRRNLTSLILQHCAIDSDELVEFLAMDGDGGGAEKDCNINHKNSLVLLKLICINSPSQQFTQICMPGVAPESSRTPLTDGHLVRILSKCPKLQYLHVNTNALVTDGILPAIREHLPRLSLLDIRGCGISLEGLHQFALLRKLDNDGLGVSEYPRFTRVVVLFPCSQAEVKLFDGTGVRIDMTFAN